MSVERLRGKSKANIISRIKRDRPPDVEGARALCDATTFQYNIYNFAISRRNLVLDEHSDLWKMPLIVD